MKGPARFYRGGALTGLVVALMACTPAPPVELGGQFVPPRPPHSWDKSENAAACSVRLASVKDLRADTQDMGQIGFRPIHANDSEAWLQSGLMSLEQTFRIRFVDSVHTGGKTIVIQATLLKSYILSQAMTKSSNVVVQIDYTWQDGSQEEQHYRGADVATNWNSASGESKEALNRALAHVIDAVGSDIEKHCSLS